MAGRVAAAWRTQRVRRTAVGLAALFLVALCLRVAWIHYVDPSPRDGRFDDTLWYDAQARAIAAGDGYLYFDGQPTAAWPIGYPAVVAGLYKATDENVLSAKLTNALLGSLTVVGVFFLGSAVFGRRAGWVAGAIIAFMPNQVFFSTLVLSEILASLLLLSAMLVILYLTLDRDRTHWPMVALAGVLLGLLGLVRGEFLLLPLVPLAVWRVAFGRWRRALACAGVMAVAMVLVLTPWTVRNWVRMGSPVVVSTGGVANLLAAHWEGANGAGTFEAGTPIQEQYMDLPNPEREVVVYRAHIRKAIAWAVRHPWEELQLIPKRLYHLYRGDASAVEWIQNKPVLGDLQFEWFETISNAYFYVLGGWVILSSIVWWNPRDPRRLLLILVGVYFSFMFGVVFVGDPRYHFGLMPAAAVMAAPAVVAVWDYVRPPRTALESRPEPVAGGSGGGGA